MPTYWKSQQIPPKKAKKKWKPGPRKATGERAVFEYVWLTRPHECAICRDADGNPTRIANAAPHCFAHQWGKGTHGGERLDPANIVLVCSTACHAAVDARRRTMRWPEVKKGLYK